MPHCTRARSALLQLDFWLHAGQHVNVGEWALRGALRVPRSVGGVQPSQVAFAT